MPLKGEGELETDTETQREGHVTLEAETGAVQLQSGMPRVARTTEARSRVDSPLQVSEGTPELALTVLPALPQSPHSRSQTKRHISKLYQRHPGGDFPDGQRDLRLMKLSRGLGG